MSHPRVEEVSDSDLSDPSEGDISDFDDGEIIRRVGGVDPGSSSSAGAGPSSSGGALGGGGGGGPRGGAIPDRTIYKDAEDAKQYANFQCLYPVYFDKTRTRRTGRRVPASLAVPNPLGRSIAQACSNLGLQVLFEPHKFHPQDWANPGRVRVKLSPPSSSSPRSGYAQINNKHHLFVLVAKWLQKNPTTEDSPALRMSVPGLPLPEEDKPWPRPAVPRGWKVGELLPVISPAMTGGGVSEGMFKDMMREMGPGGDAMAALMGGGEEPKEGRKERREKKDKKKKGKA